MSKSDPPVWLSIFIAGLIAGAFIAIGIKYGISPDELDIAIFGLEKLCETTKDQNEMVQRNCAIFIPLSISLSVILAIGSVFVEARRIDNWIVGITIYLIGWFIGLFWILSNLK